MLNTFDDTAGSPLAHMWGAELLRGGAHAHMQSGELEVGAQRDRV